MKQKFSDFAKLLFEYNKTHHITALKSIHEIEENIQDSVKPLEFLEHFSTCVDVGTGAGFPGLMLSIAQSKSHFYLVEPLKKRYAFLNLAKVILKLQNVTVVPSRIEALELEGVDLITSRAVTKTDIIINLTRHLHNPHTKMLLYKGESLQEELKNHLQMYDIIPRQNKGSYLYLKSLS